MVGILNALRGRMILHAHAEAVADDAHLSQHGIAAQIHTGQVGIYAGLRHVVRASIGSINGYPLDQAAVSRPSAEMEPVQVIPVLVGADEIQLPATQPANQTLTVLIGGGHFDDGAVCLINAILLFYAYTPHRPDFGVILPKHTLRVFVIDLIHPLDAVLIVAAEGIDEVFGTGLFSIHFGDAFQRSHIAIVIQLHGLSCQIGILNSSHGPVDGTVGVGADGKAATVCLVDGLYQTVLSRSVQLIQTADLALQLLGHLGGGR